MYRSKKRAKNKFKLTKLQSEESAPNKSQYDDCTLKQNRTDGLYPTPTLRRRGFYEHIEGKKQSCQTA